MRRVPIITAVAVFVAVVAAVVQYTVPAAVPTLQRGDPSLLTSGEWWRLVTPLLVQTLGWYQVVTNLVTLALMGAVAERLMGGLRWAVLFVAGTAAGQLGAFMAHAAGGGASIAICGLAGGTAVWLLARPEPSRWPAAVVVCYIAALAGWGFSGIPVAAVAAVVAAAVLVVSPRVALVGSVVCAVAMAVNADLHGVSLLAGMAAGFALTVLPLSGNTPGSLVRTAPPAEPSDRKP
jgi:membrane associated rhomboid family serine protease